MKILKKIISKFWKFLDFSPKHSHLDRNDYFHNKKSNLLRIPHTWICSVLVLPPSQNKRRAHFLTGSCLRQMAPANVSMHFLQPFDPAQCWNIIGLTSEKNFLTPGGHEKRKYQLKHRKNVKSGHKTKPKILTDPISPFLVRFWPTVYQNFQKSKHFKIYFHVLY